MKTRNFYFAPEVEIEELGIEQGIAFSEPSNFDLMIEDLGDEQSWD